MKPGLLSFIDSSVCCSEAPSEKDLVTACFTISVMEMSFFTSMRGVKASSPSSSLSGVSSEPRGSGWDCDPPLLAPPSAFSPSPSSSSFSASLIATFLLLFAYFLCLLSLLLLLLLLTLTFLLLFCELKSVSSSLNLFSTRFYPKPLTPPGLIAALSGTIAESSSLIGVSGS